MGTDRGKVEEQRTRDAPPGRLKALLRWTFGAAPARLQPKDQSHATFAWHLGATVLAAGLVFAGLYLASLYSYLLFHVTAELFSVLVAWGIFVLAWNSRRILQNNYLLLAGVAYLFVGGLDLIHTLAYKGMGIFPGTGTNLATQLWIAARYTEAGSLLLAPLLLGRRLKTTPWLLGYAGGTALLLASIFAWKVFPDCFIEGAGLTRFKVFSEYAICLVLTAAIALLVRKRQHFDPRVLRLVIWSIVATIAEELAFTLYKDPYGPANLLGHYLKIVSFYLIYRAIIHTGVVAPQALLFRNLQQSEQALQKARDDLENRVRERTAELAQAVERLQGEVRDRIRAEESLRESRARLSEAQRMAHLGNWDWDIVGDTLWWSDEIYRIFGRNPGEFGATYEDFLSCVHPDDRKSVDQCVRDAMHGRKPYSIDHRIVQADGTERVVHEQAEVTYDADGNPIRMMGTVQDVSERRRAEDEVRAQQQRLFSLLNMLPGYVVLLARDGVIRFANHMYLDLFGAGEKASHYAAGPARADERGDRPPYRVLDTGRPADWEWTARDGRTYRAWGYPFSDVDGTEVVLELGIDVTAQKLLEKQVLEIGEIERERIGQDLHDTVGQNLTGAAFLCTALAERLARAGAAGAADAARIEQLLSKTIAQTRSITRGLCLVETDRHGLANAIRELAANTEEVFKVACSADCDEAARVDDTSVATHLYRIAQEAVNNALKHSKAGRIVIRLSGDDHGICLSVADDGVGLPEKLDETRGIGLRTMRYRAAMIGGSLEMRANPGGGTLVECSLQRRTPGG